LPYKLAVTFSDEGMSRLQNFSEKTGLEIADVVRYAMGDLEDRLERDEDKLLKEITTNLGIGTPLPK